MLGANRTTAALGGTRGLLRANALTFRMDTQSRVACFFIGDSNAIKDGYGLCHGLHAALNARFGAYGTGLVGAKHLRSAGQRASGLDNTWPYYNTQTLNNAVRNNLTFSGASWNEGTLTLSGTFTGYTPKAGDLICPTSGTGLGAGVATADFFAQAGSTVGNIILDRSIGASASAVAGHIGNGPGASSMSFLPTAFHNAWNVPYDWEPLGAASVYHPSGSHWLECCAQIIPKWGPLSVNSRLQLTQHHILAAGGGTGGMTIAHFDGTPSDLYTSLVSLTSAAFSSAGTDGTLAQTRLTLAAGNRIGSAYGSREFLVAGSGINIINAGLNCYLATTVNDLDAPTGVTMSGFLCKGGHSLWDMAKLARDVLTDSTIDNFLLMLNDSVSAAAGGGGVLHAVGFINSGFNDHAETTTSLGTAAASSSSAAGYRDNLTVLLDRIQQRFAALVQATSVDQASTLTFVVIPSHPLSDAPTTPGTGSLAAREALTQTYRQAVLELSLTRSDIIPIDLFTLLGPDPFSALYDRRLVYSNSGVPSNDDLFHLTVGGYRWLAGKIIGAMDYAGPRGFGIGPNRLYSAGGG